MKLRPYAYLLAGLLLIQAARATDFGEVADPYTGNWMGTLSTASGEHALHASVIAGKKRFDVTFRETANPRDQAIAIGSFTADESLSMIAPETVEGATFNSEIKAMALRGHSQQQVISGRIEGNENGTFELRQVPFAPSPTLGKEPPSSATVLFDGSSLDAWQPRKNQKQAIQWAITEAGTLEVVSEVDDKRNKQDLVTKETFGDYRMHLEFNLAYKPAAKGQSRSNSGVFHLEQYETQIHDSFGLYGEYNHCGAIYKVREPDSNAAYPPGLWQTYDFEFKAAKFAADGSKSANAQLTVYLNGVLIHDAAEVCHPNGGKEPATGPIVLQDHGSPVQFRNIWIEAL